MESPIIKFPINLLNTCISLFYFFTLSSRTGLTPASTKNSVQPLQHFLKITIAFTSLLFSCNKENIQFEARYEGCAPNGSNIGAEIFGRCQHPIVAGSGEGVFEGVTGRIDMKDDIEAGNYS